MSELIIYSDTDNTPLALHTDHAGIAQVLDDIGVRFEAWEASQPLSADAGQEEVLAAYREQVDGLMSECGFQSADVVSLGPDHPDRAALREKFLSEHTHSEFEVRFFVDGSGLFNIHVDDMVYAITCEKGDLISVPAGARHWFDMGAAPNFKCIRLFTNPEGWVAEYTGDDIANRYPRFGE